MNEYPRETVEDVLVTLSLNGVTQTSFEYAITPPWLRPVDWSPVHVRDGLTVFTLDADDFGQGTWQVWVRKDGISEDPVLVAGQFRIT